MTAPRKPPLAADVPVTQFLSGLAKIRPEERRDVMGSFLTLMGFMGGHALLETARDALFLSSLPAKQLPWAYLGIAVIALPLTLSRPGFLRRLSSRHELSGWLVFSAAVTFGFWMALPLGWSGLLYALYAWSGVLATIVVVRFWTVLGNLLTVTQAKRLFAFIGTGSVLGAIAGSGAARVLAGLLPARHLVIAAAGVFLIASLGPRLLTPVEAVGTDRPEGMRSTVDLARLGRQIWGRPYLRHVAILILVSTVTFTLVDFVFKLTVSRYVPAVELDELFSSVYLTLNLLSLGVQIFLVSWLVRRLGVSVAVALVPALLLVGALGFAVGGGLVLALIFKGIDGSLRHSLYRTGTELLFVPVAIESRGRIKALIDVLGQRGGQAVASLGILVVVSATTSATVFAVAAFVMAGLWLGLAWRLQGRYLDVFRETLSEEITAAKLEFPALDLASLETLLTTLNDVDDRRVIAALDLLAHQRKLNVVPALILYHPSPTVVIHALELFADADRTEFLPIAERLREHPDAGVRAAALRAESVLRPDQSVLERGRQDPAPEVRATAVAGLVAGGWLVDAPAQDALRAITASSHGAAHIALAKAVRHRPDSVFESTLIALAGAPDESVQREAVRAMREVRSSRFVPVLIGLMGDRALRDDVQQTLLALRPSALPRLGEALGDTAMTHAIRRHLPAALAAFGSQQAADLLLNHLARETDGMIRFKILRALERLRSDHPHLELSGTVLARAIPRTVTVASQFMRWRRALEAGVDQEPTRRSAWHDLLVSLLRDKQQHAMERLFRMLDLQTRSDDFVRIYRGLRSSRRESQAGGRELLEGLAPAGMRAPLLALVDDLVDPLAVVDDPDEQPSYHAVLLELVVNAAESLSAVAANQMAELALVQDAPRIREVAPLSPAHAEVLTHTVERLDAIGQERRHG